MVPPPPPPPSDAEFTRTMLEMSNLLRSGALCTGASSYFNDFRELCLEQCFYNWSTIVSYLNNRGILRHPKEDWSALCDPTDAMKKRSIPRYTAHGL